MESESRRLLSADWNEDPLNEVGSSQQGEPAAEAKEPQPVWHAMGRRTLRCYKCGYEWETKARLKYVTCPSCHYKINSEKCLVLGAGGMSGA